MYACMYVCTYVCMIICMCVLLTDMHVLFVMIQYSHNSNSKSVSSS